MIFSFKNRIGFAIAKMSISPFDHFYAIMLGKEVSLCYYHPNVTSEEVLGKVSQIMTFGVFYANEEGHLFYIPAKLQEIRDLLNFSKEHTNYNK